MSYDNLNPTVGDKVRIENEQLVWVAPQRVFDAAVSVA